jgi:hypothetical protein
MRKTWLSLVTALILVIVSVAIFAARHFLLGGDIEGPRGRTSWHITFQAQGVMQDNDSTLVVRLPAGFRRQHIFDEHFQSAELVRRLRKNPQGRRTMLWRGSNLGQEQSFQCAYSFRCLLDMRWPTAAMAHRTREIDASPAQGAYLKPTRFIESDRKDVFAKARLLVQEGDSPADQVRAIFDYVKELKNDPAGPSSALQCLTKSRGDAAGKSRLLVALCRNRGIPARLVTGLILTRDRQQKLHFWAEAWVNESWLPLCPTYDYFDVREFPGNYLVLHIGDNSPFQLHGVDRFTYQFHVENRHGGAGSADLARPAKNFWRNLSFYALRPAEQHLVKFLLLLPLGALIVSVFRIVIGVPTFGTFAPALIGLAFLDLKALPIGLSIFVLTILVGWGVRHLLDRYHLLLVARTSILLTLIVVFLIGVIVVAGRLGVAATHFISLFPLVILTHLVERFWTLEIEDGPRTSFKTLLGTLVTGLAVSLALSPPAIGNWMFRYPETLGLVVAVQLPLGRYTGYRLAELYRFQELLGEELPAGGTHELDDTLSAARGEGHSRDEPAQRAVHPGP